MSCKAGTATRPAHRSSVRTVTGRKTVRCAAALSLAAALIHLWAAPEHLGEWWGYGAFFLATALGQGFYGATLLLRGLGRRRSLFLLGALGNLAIVALYMFTRTVGIPLLGPHAGEVEGIAPLGLAATASELALVVALGALALDRDLLAGRRGTAAFGLALVLAFFAYWMLHNSHEAPPPHDHAEHHAALHPEALNRSQTPGGQGNFMHPRLPITDVIDRSHGAYIIGKVNK